MTNQDSNEIEDLARERLQRIAEKERVDSRIAEIDALLIGAVEIGDIVTIDGAPVWRLRGNHTFNVTKAREVLTEDMVAAITVTETKVSGAQAKQLLPPALYQACTVEGKPSIRGVKP